MHARGHEDRREKVGSLWTPISDVQRPVRCCSAPFREATLPQKCMPNAKFTCGPSFSCVLSMCDLKP